jgi:hypothetical protein
MKWQLGTAAEHLGERRLPVVRGELVLLVDAHPGQLAAHPGELVAASRVLLLGGEQLTPCGEPLPLRPLATHVTVERTASS